MTPAASGTASKTTSGRNGSTARGEDSPATQAVLVGEVDRTVDLDHLPALGDEVDTDELAADCAGGRDRELAGPRRRDRSAP